MHAIIGSTSFGLSQWIFEHKNQTKNEQQEVQKKKPMERCLPQLAHNTCKQTFKQVIINICSNRVTRK